MADLPHMYAIVIGVFIVLAGILFGSRSIRRTRLSKEEKEEQKRRAGGAPI